MNYCEQTEKELLSSVLIKQDSLYQLMEYNEDIFYFAENKQIYNILKECYESGSVVDMSILGKELRKLDLFEKYEKHLLSIMKTNSPIDLSGHLEYLQDLSNKRQIELLTAQVNERLKKNDDTYKEFLNRLFVFSDLSDLPKMSESATIKELSESNLDELFKTSNFIRTGLKALDDKIIGLFNGQLVIVAGRPKMGKTTLALNIMQNIQDKVMFFSMEMKRTEIYAKILSNHTNVTSWKIELNKMDYTEYATVARTHMNLKDKLQFRVFDGAFNASKLRSAIRKYHKTEKPVAIFIDYLQLITGGQGENQNLRISSITRDLKLLAMELNIPIVLLSQLSRESEKNNRRPVMSDLRDSGSIEQDADIIIFAHEEDGQTEIIVGANRKGKSGIIKGIIFEKEFSRFRDAVETFDYETPEYIHD